MTDRTLCTGPLNEFSKMGGWCRSKSVRVRVFKTQVFHYWRKRTGSWARQKRRFRRRTRSCCCRLNNPSTLRPGPHPVSSLRKNLLLPKGRRRKKKLWKPYRPAHVPCPQLAPTIRRPSVRPSVLSTARDASHSGPSSLANPRRVRALY